MLKASKNGHLEIVKVLIRLGANVNAKDECDWTPLHYAASNGKIDILKYLIDHGAQVDMILGKYGNTPLHAASKGKGVIEVAKSLIEHGAKVDIKNEFGHTPLHTAAEKGKIDAVKCLIEHGHLSHRVDSAQRFVSSIIK